MMDAWTAAGKCQEGDNAASAIEVAQAVWEAGYRAERRRFQPLLMAHEDSEEYEQGLRDKAALIASVQDGLHRACAAAKAAEEAQQFKVAVAHESQAIFLRHELTQWNQDWK